MIVNCRLLCLLQLKKPSLSPSSLLYFLFESYHYLEEIFFSAGYISVNTLWSCLVWRIKTSVDPNKQTTCDHKTRTWFPRGVLPVRFNVIEKRSSFFSKVNDQSDFIPMREFLIHQERIAGTRFKHSSYSTCRDIDIELNCISPNYRTVSILRMVSSFLEDRLRSIERKAFVNTFVWIRRETFSLASRTRRMLPPINLMISSSDHLLSEIRYSISFGYLETSSKPFGVLINHHRRCTMFFPWERDLPIYAIVVTTNTDTLYTSNISNMIDMC